MRGTFVLGIVVAPVSSNGFFPCAAFLVEEMIDI
jgi:hypothetical protein